MSNKLNIFISIISLAFSYGLNHDVKSTKDCKSVHLENCIGEKCTIGISVVNKCHKNYSEVKTKNRCENFIDSDLRNNTFLFRPVTNLLENVTYWNIYCAWCNHQHITWENFTFWTLKAHHMRIKNDFRNESEPVEVIGSDSFVSDVDLAVIEKMKVHNETKHLISEFHGLVRRVMPLKYLPYGLRNSSLEFCSLEQNDENNRFLVENDTMAFAPAPEDFSCTEVKFCSGRKIPEPDSCVYLDQDDVPCSINQFLVKDIDFIHHFKGKIIRKDGKIFDRDAYYRLNEDLIFLCGTKNTEKPMLKIMHNLTKYMKFTSTLLLFIFLIMKTSPKTFKSLPKLILYSYCLASLGVYLYQIFSHFLLLEIHGIILKTYLLIYVFLCHAFWASIISYEYWYVISAALKFKKPNIEMRRYWIYGFIGWILPALLLCAVYPSLTAEDKACNCFAIPDYKNRNIGESFSDPAHMLHFSLAFTSALTFFILIPVLGVQGCFFIRLIHDSRNMSRRKAEGSSNATRSISELDYWFIFTKIAYLMGIHWMLICINLLLSFLDISFFSHLGSVLFSCHGTFIFFAFGFKNVRTMYRSTYRSRDTQSTRI